MGGPTDPAVCTPTVVHEIVKELTNYGIPFLSASINSIPQKLWLTHENLFIPVRIFNAGVAAEAITIALDLGKNIEPLSTTEIFIATIGRRRLLIGCVKRRFRTREETA
jgi:hypothetical protein